MNDKPKVLLDSPVVIAKNLSNVFKDKQQIMIDSCLEHRAGTDFNFTVKMTSLYQQLYNEFQKLILETFVNVTPLNDAWHNNPKCWAYLFDETTSKYADIGQWHNHIDSSTINGVFYLKLAGDKENGIGFKSDNNNTTIMPEEFDMLIFSGDTMHIPLRPDDKSFRLSINLECMCEESIKDLFKRENIKL